MIAYWKIRARLLRVPGVANVAIWGERLQMLHVQVDPKRLAAQRRLARRGHGRDRRLARLRACCGSPTAQFIGTGGFVETADRHAPEHPQRARHRQRRTTSRKVADRAPRRHAPARLRDVADVREDHQPLVGDAVINGGPGLMLIVEKFPWANTLDVTQGVEEALDDMRPGLPGIDDRRRRSSGRRRSSRRRCDNLTTALLLGCLLVVARSSSRSCSSGARRVDQPDHDPAVAASRRCSCSTCTGRRSTSMVLAGLRHRGRRGRRRRDHRHREHHAAAAPAPRRRGRRRSRGAGDPRRRRWRSAARSSTRR